MLVVTLLPMYFEAVAPGLLDFFDIEKIKFLGVILFQKQMFAVVISGTSGVLGPNGLQIEAYCLMQRTAYLRAIRLS